MDFYNEEIEEEEDGEFEGGRKKGNNLPQWGNAQTMNLNPLIFTNITSSPYFKVTLIQFKVSKGKRFESLFFCLLRFKSKTM